MAYEIFLDAIGVLEADIELARNNPFVIQEETLAETVKSISAIPEDERKLVIYSGVHPHERTTALIGKYAEEWRATFGALVISHPTNETPHGIWSSHIQAGRLINVAPLSPDTSMNEDSYEDAFSLGSETFFIRLHGTASRSFDDTGHWTPKLDIATSMYNQYPEMYYDGRTLKRHSKPGIIAGLEDVVDDVEALGYPGNVICAEYYYNGNPVTGITPQASKLLAMAKARHANGIPTIFSSDDSAWFTKGNIKPEYLVQRIMNDADMVTFHKQFKSPFGAYLATSLHKFNAQFNDFGWNYNRTGSKVAK